MKIDTKERKEIFEFVKAQAGIVHSLLQALEQRFAETPEGKELGSLRNLLSHIVTPEEAGKTGNKKQAEYFDADSVRRFVSFISNNGEVSIRAWIAYLEHAHIRGESKLLEKMREIEKDAQAKKLADWKKWEMHSSTRSNLKDRLPINENVPEFVANLNGLVRPLVAEYPDTPLAEAIKEPKKIPDIVALENYELVIGIWRLIARRLFKPFDEKQNHIRHLVESTNENRIIEAIGRKTGKSAPDINKEITKYLPERVENNQLKNILAFQDHLDDRENTLLRVLSETGQKKEVKKFLDKFGSNRKRVTPPLISVEIYDGFISPLETEMVKREHEAKARLELARLLEKTLKLMKAALQKAHQELVEAVRERIRHISEKNEKSVKALKECSAELSSLIEKIEETQEVIGESELEFEDKNIIPFRQGREERSKRSFEIANVMDARIELSLLLAGDINQSQFDTHIRDIVKRVEDRFNSEQRHPEFSVSVAINIQRLADERIKGLDDAAFSARLQQIDYFINQVRRQIGFIANQTSSAYNDLLGRGKETGKPIEEMMNFLSQCLEQAKVAAEKSEKIVREVGGNAEVLRLHHEPDEADVSRLEGLRRAA